ncbi:MAG: PIG-L family deacetylase [Acidimicrobiales bacterium]
MSTLVCFHAHPDDEALSTGGLMAKASAAGHRVILVTATRGEQGEPQPGVLAEGEQLWERRVLETAEAAEILGAEPPYFLDYEDSGMIGESTNDNPKCFWQADLDEAANRLAGILDEVEADVLTIYDDHGLYGHPDHIQVHRVGVAAAEIAGIDHVYEATVNRDRSLEGMSEMAAEMEAEGIDAPNLDDFEEFGVAEKDLGYAVDVHAFLDAKRAAMAVHRSQISEQSFFLYLPPERFATVFAFEHFAVPGRTDTGGPDEVELLPGL